jgi:hypothetical protein
MFAPPSGSETPVVIVTSRADQHYFKHIVNLTQSYEKNFIGVFMP